MNVKAACRCVGLLCAALSTITPAIALAWDWRNDPLATRPAIMADGPTLPGTEKSIACAEMSSATGASPVALNGPLTLERALLIALCNNPQLQSAFASIKVQAAALGESKAA